MGGTILGRGPSSERAISFRVSLLPARLTPVSRKHAYRDHAPGIHRNRLLIRPVFFPVGTSGPPSELCGVVASVFPFAARTQPEVSTIAELEHLKPIVASINTLIGSCENMEATYCVGNDVDVCRMFDQYLYKVRNNC